MFLLTMSVYLIIGTLFSLVIEVLEGFLSRRNYMKPIDVKNSWRIVWICGWPYFLVLFIRTVFSGKN